MRRRRFHDAVNLRPLARRAWAWLSWQVAVGRVSPDELAAEMDAAMELP